MAIIHKSHGFGSVVQAAMFDFLFKNKNKDQNKATPNSASLVDKGLILNTMNKWVWLHTNTPNGYINHNVFTGDAKDFRNSGLYVGPALKEIVGLGPYDDLQKAGSPHPNNPNIRVYDVGNKYLQVMFGKDFRGRDATFAFFVLPKEQKEIMGESFIHED